MHRRARASPKTRREAATEPSPLRHRTAPSVGYVAGRHRGAQQQGHQPTMRKNSLLTNLAIGAAAMGLAGAGGYMARAGVGPQGAVNAAPLPTAGVGAPVSFA